MRNFKTIIESWGQNIDMIRFRKTDGRKSAFLAGMAFLVALVLFSIFFRGIKVRGQEQCGYKYYTSIEIQSGDTLWGIASEIAAAYDLDTRTCVRELMLMNNLKNDTIHAGNYLTVFYYGDDYK